MSERLYPPTIFIVHPKEKRSKCSIEPLRGREEFVFWKYPNQGPESLEGYVRLGIGGPLLSEADSEKGLLILDGTWRLAEKMEADYAHLPVRSLAPTWQTAYPRKSKIFDDPSTGLATIEALFAAQIHLGRPVEGLLDEYHWGEEFVELNQQLINAND
ncbi:MAG: hypothetical protein KDA65_00680 [Planctomycetaceae bacterium]|nr:hypothetical protein [Planctomycetaceae bacterium]